MDEIALVSSNKDTSGIGIAVVDINHHFKNCITESNGTFCTIGQHFGGYNSEGAGDFVAVAQGYKPSIHIYQWGKPQIHFQCHLQEICTSIASDPSGLFLFAGTRKGWLYCWDTSTGELLTSWQAHFKEVSRIRVTSTFCVTVGEDGLGRVWELNKILDSADIEASQKSGTGKQNIQIFRSWNPHTLPVRDMCILGADMGLLRVLTCSMDKTIVLYDVLFGTVGKICLRLSLPDSLECVTTNPLEDIICVGSTSGTIYIIDLSVAAIAISASQSSIFHLSENQSKESNNSSKELKGHSKKVTSLSFCKDNMTLVSSSEDGSVRMW